MKEVFLNNEVTLSDFETDAEGTAYETPVVETRNGREWVRWTYERDVSGLSRAVKLIQAIVLTVFTLFLGLFFSEVRLFWGEGFSGREKVAVFNPLSKEGGRRGGSEDALERQREAEAASSPGYEDRVTLHEDPFLEERAADAVQFSDSEGDSRVEIRQGREPLLTAYDLHGERKEIQQLLNELQPPPSGRIISFIEGCLRLYGGKLEWVSFKNSWYAYSLAAEIDPAPSRLTELFHEAVSLIKDHKVAAQIDKLHEKILAPIELDGSPISHRPHAVTPSSPGVFSKRSALIGSIRTETYSAPGERPTMEDQDLAVDLQVDRPEGRISVPCFAIFDGHGGGECALFLKSRFAEFITSELKRAPALDELHINNALKLAFVKANTEFKMINDNLSGSKAIVALVINNVLWVANAGDSRAVLSDGGVALQLSDDAKPAKEAFRKGVLSRGGYVFWGRVNGELATARAFGDKSVIGVTARPKIRKVDISQQRDESRQLILASDGLFSVAGSDEAVDAIRGFDDPAEAAKRLFNLAFERGTRDNVTVMVARLSE